MLLNDRAIIGVSDHQGSQEVHKACQYGREIHLDHLIFYGANINSRTASGNTPLHICAIANQEKCARLLLFRGAKTSVANYSNQTPYEVAVISGNNAIAALIEEFDVNDVTPLKTKPVYSKRRRDNRLSGFSTVKNVEPERFQEFNRTSTLPSRTEVDQNKENMFLKRKNSLSQMNGKREAEQKREVEQKKAVSDDSGSESSDSDEETNKANQIDRRAFSTSGVGTRRSPAPIKAIHGERIYILRSFC